MSYSSVVTPYAVGANREAWRGRPVKLTPQVAIEPTAITNIMSGASNLLVYDPNLNLYVLPARQEINSDLSVRVSAPEVRGLNLSGLDGITLELAGSTRLDLAEYQNSINIMAPELRVSAERDLLTIETEASGSTESKKVSIASDGTSILIIRDSTKALEERLDRLMSQSTTLATALKVFSLVGNNINNAKIAEDDVTGKLKVVVDTGSQDDWNILSASKIDFRRKRLDEVLLNGLWTNRKLIKQQEQFEDFGIDRPPNGGSRVVMEISPNGLFKWQVFDEAGNQSNLDGLHQIMQQAFGNFNLVCKHKPDTPKQPVILNHNKTDHRPPPVALADELYEATDTRNVIKI